MINVLVEIKTKDLDDIKDKESKGTLTKEMRAKRTHLYAVLA